jgi:hypothetical protein
LKRGWLLLCLVCNFVVPTETFFPYLQKFLQTAASQKDRAHYDIAQSCIERLRLNRASPRVLAPSQEEVECIENDAQMTLRILFPDGSNKSFIIESHMLAKDLVRNITTKYDIISPENYGFFIMFQPGNFSTCIR